jgi:hypothetical protein
MGYTLSYDIATFGHDAVSEAIAVKSDGKVGIGTTDPSQPLHVNGASLLGGTTTIGGNLVPAISTLMDIGTSSFKWRNLVLSGTAGIGGALTGTTATFSGNVTGANVYTEAGGQVRAYRGSGGSSYGSLSMDTGETLHLANSWSGKKLSLTRDGDLQLSGTTVIDASRNLTNIGTISSGAITTTGALTGTTATFSGQVKTTNQFRISADYAVQYFYKANNSTMLGYLLMRDDETNYLSTAGGQDFAIVDTVTNTRWITFQTSTKNVGIGTTDPGTYKLKVEGTTWLNDVTFIAGNNTAPPTTSNSQDFGAIRMSDGALRSMYQGCTATYGWIQVMSSTNHATNYPLALNPNGGSVGIGTNAPAAPLDVHGSMVRISSDGGAYRRLMFFDSLATPSKNNFQVAVQEINNALHIGPSTAVGGTTFSGSTGLAMLANGSVGIGDASPSYKLDVNGTGRFTGALSSGAITVDTSGGTDNYYLTCKEAGTARFSIYENANNVYLNAFTSLNLRANQIGGSGGQIGLYGGPVVIGETLAVTGALTGTSATFSGGSVGWYNAASIRGHLGMTGNEGDLSIYRSNTVKHVYLSSYYDSYINPAIGNVGIGTTNPGTWKLRVEGTGFFNGSVVVPNGSSYFGAYNSSGVLKSLIYLSSSNEVIINKDHLSAQPTKIRGKYITFETPDSVLGADIEVMRVFQGSGFMTAGCVGIGVTTPSSKLDVNGTITGTSKNFNIPHPDPSKINARLIHASIEAPSNDTLYKFEVVISLDNETVTHPLPSYFKYLNKNPRMWIQARDMFSHAYGSCAEDLSSFSITGEKAGNYDVLIIATRKDEGVEGFVVEIDA